MKRKKLSELTGNEILAQSLMTWDYQIILPEGAVLKKEYIDKIEEMGILEVYVKEDLANEIVILKNDIEKTIKSKLKKRLDKFLTGKDGTSLEQDIAGLYEDNKFLKANTEKNKKDIRTLYRNMESAYQKMGLVKYDAFNQMGGQLSFSLALLDENNNGFIINSVHSSEGCYSYTKEIKLGQCAIDLGAEEAEALSMAMGE